MTKPALQDIKIVADPTSATVCRFTIDRPVLPNQAYHFADREQAEGSALAERLFGLEGVAAVLIAHERVVVTKSTMVDWRVLGKEIGAAIRAHFAGGAPAVMPELLSALPSEDEIRERVQEILDREINPAVASHGGHIALLDVRGNSVYLRMGGGCQGCGMADVTLKQGVEKTLRHAVPELGEILDATDHAAGRNPYYAPGRK
jgi:Fe-S cluster biogenesis protein NfuA